MEFYTRRLPYVYATEKPVFLTWRLFGSLPQNRPFPGGLLPSGQAFVAMDRLLDEARTGPSYLRLPPVANIVMQALQYNANVLEHYQLHAFVIMPNHVHILASAAVPLPKLTRSLKSITARRVNQLLGLTGKPFWQEETYDHVVRNGREFENISHYIEQNPVLAGLVRDAAVYRWSSANWCDGLAQPGVAPGVAPRVAP